MILYNVTIIMDEEIHQDWLNWANTHHINEVMNTGCFVSYRILKVLDSPNEGLTYCIQYIADSLENYNEYIQKYLSRHQAGTPDQFLNKLVNFQTVMEFIETK